MFLKISGTKLKKLQIADFEQLWVGLFLFYQFLTVLSSFFRKFNTQIPRTNLLSLWTFFDIKSYQSFSTYLARKVKFRRFHVLG